MLVHWTTHPYTTHLQDTKRNTHTELDDVGSQQHTQTLNQVADGVDECGPHVDVPGIAFVARSSLTAMAVLLSSSTRAVVPMSSSMGVVIPVPSMGVAVSKDSAHAKENKQ